jgi:hypothetical protein
MDDVDPKNMDTMPLANRTVTQKRKLTTAAHKIRTAQRHETEVITSDKPFQIASQPPCLIDSLAA